MGLLKASILTDHHDGQEPYDSFPIEGYPKKLKGDSWDSLAGSYSTPTDPATHGNSFGIPVPPVEWSGRGGVGMNVRNLRDCRRFFSTSQSQKCQQSQGFGV